MRAVVQRVSRASVSVGDRCVGAIGRGLLVLVGVGERDGPEDVRYLAGKIPALRVFDGDGKGFHRSVVDVGGAVLVVSQFTLYGDTRGQRRPSFTGAAAPERARDLYEALVRQLRDAGLHVETGEFQAAMEVELVNDGPVTLLLDSSRLF
ncbi:MAG: D-tyrosyl-tRNA(Tyr) deacylase [Acidimicrobiia bacterium]|nr:D-tyrosyl-tRNA(Tyr) deacylase [Acidimicrobiia bacterium]